MSGTVLHFGCECEYLFSIQRFLLAVSYSALNLHCLLVLLSIALFFGSFPFFFRVQQEQVVTE